MTLPRLYPILDTGALARLNCPAETAAEAILAGGAEILQFRHKGQYSGVVFEQVEKVAALCRSAGAAFVVNDRADVALMLDAGLHVGQDDLPPADARRLLGAGRILGFSTHNASQLWSGDSEPVDYLAVGPVFGTSSKQKPDPVLGVEELGRLRVLTQKPLVAIGGITRENVLAVLEAGADSVAVIAGLLPETCDFETLRTRMGEWQQLVKK